MTRTKCVCGFMLAGVAAVCGLWAGCNKTGPATSRDGATFDADGTAHITRVVPMPSTVSPEAQKWLASLTQKSNAPQTLEQRRAGTDEWRKRQSAEARRLFPVNLEEATTAGVRTDILTPLDGPARYRDRVLISLHGGGFNSDSGSLIEGVPICNLAKIKVVSVYYRLAPENPFPAAVDDVVRVYKELLKTYKPHNIGIFGTSAGATLTAEVAARLGPSGMPLPGRWGCSRCIRTTRVRRIRNNCSHWTDCRGDWSPAIRIGHQKTPTPGARIARIQCCRRFSRI